MKSKHRFGAVLCVLLSCGAKAQLLDDNFNDGVIDTSKWQVILPFAQSSVVESSGTLTTTGKGFLATVSNMPSTFSITGSFRLNNALEICRVVLRSDLSIHSGLAQYSERRGIWVTFHAANGFLYIENGLQQGPPTGPGLPYQWVIGQTYNFSIVDDSQNVSVLINGVTGFSFAITNRVGSKIALTGREFASTSSTFDNVRISTLPLKIYTAIELEFPTEPGKAYTVQSSPDLTNWTNFDAFLGNGDYWRKLYSTRGQSKLFYRVVP